MTFSFPLERVTGSVGRETRLYVTHDIHAELRLRGCGLSLLDKELARISTSDGVTIKTYRTGEITDE